MPNVYEFGASLVTGIISAASVTATTAGTAVTVATCTTDHKFAMVTNSLDTPVWLTYDGVRAFFLPALTPIAIDLNPNGRRFSATKIIGIYHDGSIPTTGKLAVTLS